MNPEIYIIAAAFLGTALGSAITAAHYRWKLRRNYKQTWNSARVFYTRLHSESKP